MDSTLIPRGLCPGDGMILFTFDSSESAATVHC